MKNKTLKNLIALGAFAIFAISFNSAFAYDTIPTGYNVGYSYSQYGQDSYNSYNANPYYYEQRVESRYIQPQQNNYGMAQPYGYAQPQPQPQPQIKYVEVPGPTQIVQGPTQIKYVEVPGPTQIKYVPQQTVQTVQYAPQQPTIQYVSANTQGASVAGSTTTRVVNPVVVTSTGTKGNSGQFVNFDQNSQSLGASAYGVYSDQQVAYDTNGVTALSVGGSGSFMPSSVFQWFILILLILAIIIIARMVSKTFSRDSHSAPVH